MAVAVTGQAKETDELYVKHPLPVSPFLPPLFAFLTRRSALSQIFQSALFPELLEEPVEGSP